MSPSRRQIPASFGPLAMQTAAAAIGLLWGWAAHERAFERYRILGRFDLAGTIAPTLLACRIPSIRDMRSPVSRPGWVCLATAIYASAIMFVDPLRRQDSEGVVAAHGILLMTPLLFAIGYLERAGERQGALGAALFMAACIAMVLFNGLNRGSWHGFFNGLTA